MKVKIPLYSLDCTTCELLLASRVSECAWVPVKSIKKIGNEIHLDVENDAHLQKVKKVIADFGYQITPKATPPTPPFTKLLDLIVTLLVLAICGMLFFLLKDTLIFSGVVPTKSAGIFTMMVLGFLASLSTCLAITGGIIFGFSRHISPHNTSELLQIHGGFHGGRLLWFVWGGAILWGVGSIIGISLNINMILLAIAGSVLVYLWGNILGILPSLKIASIFPKSWWVKIFSQHAKIYAPLVGAWTFLLPCWFTQWAQIYAISTGSALQWALALWAFALWTFPVLFAIGIGSSFFTKKNFYFLNKIVGSVVILFGVFLLQGWYNLLGLGVPQHTSVLADNTDTQAHPTDITEVVIPHYGFMFWKKEIFLSAKGNYLLSITPDETGTGCSESFVIPGIDPNIHPVRKWVNISIPVLNAQSGTYPILCSTTGTVQAKIVIN